ncbi:hypothetical protein [uncultured Mediterranean phage uvMED]|nr:hypothetical protein [uncultured Mediterranean phage uvMED]
MAYLQVKQLGEIRVVEPARYIIDDIVNGNKYLILHKFRGVNEEPYYGFMIKSDDIITVEISCDEFLDEEYDKKFKYKK